MIVSDLESTRITQRGEICNTVYDYALTEWLDLHLFNSVEHAQLLATQWLWQYNNERPHTAIGGIPPRQLLNVA